MSAIKELQVAISNLSVWRKGDQRAPHKPLLLLYVLSQYQKGHERLFAYGEEIHQPLLELLNNFGPRRKTHYPSLPFWRLRGDGFWELQNTELCTPQKGSKEPPKRELIEFGVKGGFDQQSYQLLRKKPATINKLAQQILSEHFPDSIQELLANQLDFSLSDIRKIRDPHFRQQILRAYNYQCAICGYNLRHDSTPVGLEAAHIKWKQYGGPCTVNNGLALCSLHHSAFDMGSISIDDNMNLLVSESVNGGTIVKQLFWNLAKQPILRPLNKDYYPLESFIAWHRNQVFKE
ncbi:phosphorothioated DNA-binding restriction endonuclease [Xenorhabdus griffiniae]|uniref:phosphorothioated DNA-binding restriction endonuclease n=1 Tax=Xenorhabdus griffiniae TaxID=351672 RepID=UPI0023582605|nr:HNH endonuclease [Xenorhabdus griffiniae]MDC9606310.1 HNH endonuclease [Xenorhabdus griffiniae]